MFPLLAKAVVWVIESFMGLMVIALFGFIAYIIVMMIVGAANH